MAKKLILSIDGGGTRGAFEVGLISLIEEAMGKKMYEMIDAVVGVSVGSIIAAKISEKKYTKIENELLNPFEIFRQKHSKSGGIFETLYTGAGKTNALKRAFKSKKMADLLLPTAILTVKMQTGEAYAFTNYDINASNTTVTEIVDASSAAPIYFPAVKIHGEYYIDGGYVNNDPVFVAIEFAKKLWPEIPLTDIAILSIGAGISANIDVKTQQPTDFGLLRWLSEGLITIMTDSRRNYNEPIVRLLVGEGNYLRITTTATGATDNVTIIKKEELYEAAGKIWMEHGTTILNWLETHISK